MKLAFITVALLTVLYSTHDAAAAERAASPPLNWYRCNTHTHTSAPPGSDANATPEAVAEWYRTHGYHCVVITDHEFLTDVASLNRKYAATGDFLVLPGQEITQAMQDASHHQGIRHLHVNGINIDRAIMPLGHPAPAKDVSPAQTYTRNIDAVYSAGGIPQVNHPNLRWSVRTEDLMPIAQPFLLEVWNAFPTSNNLGGSDESGETKSTEALWDALLSKGKIVWAVASDDAHEYARLDDRLSPTPGHAWIVVRAPSLTARSITKALREGQFYASTGVTLETYTAEDDGVSMTITPTPEWGAKGIAAKGSTRYVTKFFGANGRVLDEMTGLAPRYHFKGDETYIRASIVDSDGRRAWTQPIFLDGRATREAT